MTGWIALVLIVAVVVATAAIFAAGRKAGAAAEKAVSDASTINAEREGKDAQARMLDACANAPRDRDALAERLRDGTF